MEREEHRHKGRKGESEPQEDAPNQEGVDSMQQRIDQMVAEGCETPQLVLDPKDRIGQGVVLA
jgi:hypothetical protein